MANLPSLWRGGIPEWRSEGLTPFRSLFQMQRDMDRLFNDFLGGSFVNAMPMPSFETKDNDTHYLLKFEVPGMGRDEVKIETRDNMLHLYGAGEKGKGEERSYSSFDQWISLPTGVKAESIEAHLEHGVLQVAIPKPEESKSRQIKIGEGKTGFFGRLLEKKSKAA